MRIFIISILAITVLMLFLDKRELKTELLISTHISNKRLKSYQNSLRLTIMLDSIADLYQSSRNVKHNNKEIQKLSTNINFKK